MFLSVKQHTTKYIGLEYHMTDATVLHMIETNRLVKLQSTQCYGLKNLIN